MANQLTTNAEALRLFFTEEVYLVKDIDPSPVTVAPTVEPKTPIAQKPEAEITVPEPKKEWQFEHLGKNQKRILILVNDAQYKVSSPQGTELLRKLVKAIELSNNDFALVNYAAYPDADFQAFKEFFDCELLLAFGVSAPQLGLQEALLHKLTQLNQIRMIFTHNLHDLDSDVNSKKILWSTLQTLKS
ncbi:MAG: hypothetical protein REI78_11140 [Pedobacter sp.]|nr:hypothetical protein [Pedobacter sp.]MDQ8053576.1 hypothetical protein [Pedobacter sp.]